MREILRLCGGVPERTVAADTIILADGERTGELFVLIEGTVEIVKGDVQVNVVSDPGAVFGEMSVLLDTPHTAMVRTTAPSRFHVIADGRAFLERDTGVALAISRLLARRLHGMTTYLVDLKHQFADHDDHFGMVDTVLEVLAHHQGEEQSPGSDRDPDPNVS